ncbi:MAG TPA: hypothetical protein VF712_18365 [Thermoleophilaceae bacterium]|jgi:hypothetical protein
MSELRLGADPGQDPGTIKLPPEQIKSFRVGSSVAVTVPSASGGTMRVLEVLEGAESGALVGTDDWNAITANAALGSEPVVELVAAGRMAVWGERSRRLTFWAFALSLAAAGLLAASELTMPDKKAERADHALTELRDVEDRLDLLNNDVEALARATDDVSSVAASLARDADTRKSARALKRAGRRLDQRQRSIATTADALERWQRGLEKESDEAGSPSGKLKLLAGLGTFGAVLLTGLASLWGRR